MDVKFYYTTKSKLDSLPVVNGQIIALQDAPGYYYDMNGVRYKVNQVEIVDTRPSTGKVNIIYISKSPEGVYTWSGSAWQSVIAVDIHEAPNDARMYGRRGKDWRMMRWILESDAGSNIPVATVNSAISSLLSNWQNASLQIVGTVSMTAAMTVTTAKTDQFFELDLSSMVPSSNSYGITLKATNAKDAINVRGRIYNAISGSGNGRITLDGCQILAAVTFAGACNGKVVNCDMSSVALTHSNTSTSAIGSLVVSGCHINAGTITTQDETKCYTMIGDNILVGTVIKRGSTTISGLYNNEGR